MGCPALHFGHTAGTRGAPPPHSCPSFVDGGMANNDPAWLGLSMMLSGGGGGSSSGDEAPPPVARAAIFSVGARPQGGRPGGCACGHRTAPQPGPQSLHGATAPSSHPRPCRPPGTGTSGGCTLYTKGPQGFLKVLSTLQEYVSLIMVRAANSLRRPPGLVSSCPNPCTHTRVSACCARSGSL